MMWTVFAPVATFATSKTYDSVRRLSSWICICRCLLWFGSTWAFAVCRCFGGSIGVIVFRWILMACTWFSDWGSLWWSSSLCCRCCRGWSLWFVTCRPWMTALGTLFLVDCWSIEDGVLFAAFLGWWLLWLCSCVICFWWDEPSLDVFVCNGFIWIIWSVTARFMVGLIEICCFTVWLWSLSFLRCRCQSSTFYTTVSRGLRIVHVKGDGAYFA